MKLVQILPLHAHLILILPLDPAVRPVIRYPELFGLSTGNLQPSCNAAKRSPTTVPAPTNALSRGSAPHLSERKNAAPPNNAALA